MSILNVSSKIGLMVAAFLLLASGVFFTIGKETLAGRLGLAGGSLLIVGIVFLLVLSIRRSPKGTGEDER